jgi:putative endonuclease
MKQPVVYIMTNQYNETLYTGVSSNLIARVYEHRNHIKACFTTRYHCTRLVFYEIHETMESAIMREKQIKAGSRKKKIALIEGMNPEWKDLYDELF